MKPFIFTKEKYPSIINSNGLVINIKKIISFCTYQYAIFTPASETRFYIKINLSGSYLEPIFTNQNDCQKAYNDLLAAISNGEK